VPAAQSASREVLHPVWICAIIVVSALPAFLVLHLFITVVLGGQQYQFPFRLTSRGPRYCPHCGALREVGTPNAVAAADGPGASQSAS
jgi:hypothetical protein